MHLTDAQLLASRAGALDPSGALAVREELAASAALRRRAERLGLHPEETPVTGWRLPPPGLGAWRLSAQPVAIMGGLLRAGGRARTRLPDVSPERFVVVLRREEDTWNVVFPTGPAELLRVADLPEAGSTRFLDVTAGPGKQRWAVVFPREAPDWSLVDPWERVRDAVTLGLTPAGTFELQAA